MWSNLAVSLGNKNAMKLRDLIAQEMTSGQITDAQDAARPALRGITRGADGDHGSSDQPHTDWKI